MKGKILKVLVVLTIIASMTMVNFLNIGMQIAYAIDNLDTQNTSLNSEVDFDVTLSENKNHEMKLNTSEGGNLYINVNVKAGSLNGAKIQIQNANFEIGKVENEFVKSVDESAKTIELNNIQYGNNVTIVVPITFNKQNQIDEDYFNRETTFNLSGNYANGEEKSVVSGDIVAKVIWEAEADTELSTEIEKFVEIESGKYLIQQKVEVNTINNSLPKQEEIVTISNDFTEVPTEIVVLKNGDKLSEDKITKNDQTKTVTITTNNNPINGKITWEEGKDVYKVIYILESDTQPTSVLFNTNAETKFYNKEEKVTKQDTKNGSTQGLTIKGKIVSATAESTKEQYKGYMYYGKDNETKYNQKYSIEISNVEQEKEINTALLTDLLVKEDGSKTGLNGNYPYFKTIAIDKENMKEILGQDGKITITTGINSRQVIVDANSEANDDGYIMVNCVEDNGAKSSIVNVDTTAPVTEGTLDIFVEKAISGNTGLTKDVLKQVKAVEAGIKLNNEDITTQTQLLDTIDPLAKLTMENNVISTINQENNNVKMYVTLVANSNKYDLYKNPQVVVTLPKEVEDFDFEFNPLYADGLTLTNEPALETNADGTKKIVFTFSGEQANFGNNAVEGVVLEISGNMTVNKLIPTTNTKIKMTYTNANKSETVYEKETDLKINSKDGILTYTKVTGFNGNEDVLETMSDEVVNGTLDMEAEAKTAKVDMAIINNNLTTVTDAVILGKLDSSFETTLATAVEVKNVDGAKVYYSSNVDEELESEDWKENFEGAKSYKVVLPNNELANGQIVEFGYSFNVPEKLSYNQEADISYRFDYNVAGGNNKATSGVKLATEKNEAEEEENKMPSILRNLRNTANILSTPQDYNLSDKLEVSVDAISAGNSLKDGDTVKEGQTIRYEVTLKNNSEQDITNLKLTAKHTNATFFVKKYIDAQGVTNGIEQNDYVEEDASVEELELEVGTIQAGKEKTIIYAFTVKEIEEKNQTTEGTIKITADDMEAKQIETISNNIEKSKLKLVLHKGQSDYLSITSNDAALPLFLKTTNIYSEKLENVILEMKLPEYATANLDEAFEIASISGNVAWEIVEYNKDTNVVKLKIPSIEVGETIEIAYFVYFWDMDINSTEEKVSISYEAYFEDSPTKKYISNEVIETIIQANGKIEITQTSSLEDKSTLTKEDDGKKITFKAEIENTGKLDLDNLIISDTLPEGFNAESAYYVINGQRTNIEIKNITANADQEIVYIEENGDSDENISGGATENIDNNEEAEDIENIGTPRDISFSYNLDEGEKIAVYIETVFKYSDVDTRTPENVFSAANDLAEAESNIITFNVDIEDNNPDYVDEKDKDEEEEKDEIDPIDDRDNSDSIDDIDDSVSGREEKDPEKDPYENALYDKQNEKTIEGKVWLDKNKNGQYDDDEKGISNVKVNLIDATSGEYIKDSEENIISSVTEEDGSYTLEGIAPGKYLVTFDYDYEKYRLTDYKKEGISEEINSDAIMQEITIEENTKNVAITDTIEINEENYSNVNVGLIEKEIFDMSLDKYISKIVIQNKQGTTIKEYSKTQLAKIEIDRKYLANSTVIIEYTINVTNNGELSGYVGDIIDYIPNDLSFNSEINKDWFIGSDKNLHNTSLVNEEIKPGKNKVLTLTLTKTMTDNNAGTVINTAEIGKATNEYDIVDIDSKVSNKVQGEDDMSTAEVIISIRTGIEAVVAIGSILIILIIIAGSMYYIKKRKEGENA